MSVSLLKEKLKALPTPVNAETFAKARDEMRALGGAAALYQHLESEGFVAQGKLTTAMKPLNFFACISSGVISQPGMESENASLGHAGLRFKVCSNHPDNNENWNSSDPAWVGKAAMSKRHRFLSTKDLSWQWFNVLAFGLDRDAHSLSQAIALLEDMKSAAEAFAAATPEWSADPSRLGLFLHVFPHNSVDSLHLHMVDLAVTGPTYEVLKEKNLPLADALDVLRSEESLVLAEKEGMAEEEEVDRGTTSSILPSPRVELLISKVEAGHVLSSDEAEELKRASIGDEVAHEHLASTDESNQMHELVDRLKLLEDLFYTINNGSTSVSMHSLAHLINGLDEDTQIFFHQIDTETGWTEERTVDDFVAFLMALLSSLDDTNFSVVVLRLMSLAEQANVQGNEQAHQQAQAADNYSVCHDQDAYYAGHSSPDLPASSLPHASQEQDAQGPFEEPWRASPRKKVLKGKPTKISSMYVCEATLERLLSQGRSKTF